MKLKKHISICFSPSVKNGTIVCLGLSILIIVSSVVVLSDGSSKTSGVSEILKNKALVYVSMKEEIKNKGLFNVLSDIAQSDCIANKHLGMPREYYNQLLSQTSRNKIAEENYKKLTKSQLEKILFEYFNHRVWGPVQEDPPTMPN